MARLMHSVMVLAMVGVALTTIGCADPKMEQMEQDMQEANDRIAELEELYDQAERARIAAESEAASLRDQADRLKRQLAEAQQPIDGWDNVPGGTMISIEGQVLFESGKAELKASGKKTLDQVAEAVNNNFAGQDIYVFGHTDNQPIEKSKWDDNYELSCQRALAVLRYLKSQGVENYIAACGWGMDRPVASNETKEGRKKNRRVEVFALER